MFSLLKDKYQNWVFVFVKCSDGIHWECLWFYGGAAEMLNVIHGVMNATEHD